MKEDRLYDYLSLIRRCALDACFFMEGFDLEAFSKDERTQRAVAMTLLMLGEEAKKVMDNCPEFSLRHSEIPWRVMRNVIAHDYFSIKIEVVWDTVTDKLPELISRLDVCIQEALDLYG